MHIPTAEQFFSGEDPTKPDVNFLKNHFYREGRVSEEQALYILEKATDILKQEPNLISVDAPVTGETHVLSARYTYLTPYRPGFSLR
jgi:serine/threonine-protein phosphatase 2B catalytic subunit